MRVMIIDDEQLAIDILRLLLKKNKDIEVVASFTSPLEALKRLPELTIDVVFLDMEVGELHGLEFASTLSKDYPNIEVVFVTAHPQFAIEAFEVNVIDYLLKPVSPERLMKTIRKIKRRSIKQINESHMPKEKTRILTAQFMNRFRLFDPDGHEMTWRTRKVMELFAFLWHHQEGVHRSQMIMELWPELPEDKATTIMHTTVYQLRKALGDIGLEKSVIFENRQYKLNVPVKTDLDELYQIISDDKIDDRSIERAIHLYTDDYLAINNYGWVLPAQEMIRRKFLGFLEGYVLTIREKGKQSFLIERCLKKMIELDPYQVEYQCRLIEYYGTKGDTQKVISLFKEATLKWTEELGLDLPQKITDLYKKYI